MWGKSSGPICPPNPGGGDRALEGPLWVSDSTDLGTAVQWLELTLVDLDSPLFRGGVAFSSSEWGGRAVCKSVPAPGVGG